MASYFDEFNFTPLAEGQIPDHQLDLARFLLDTGLVQQDDWDLVFPGGKPPPTSKNFVDSLTSIDFPGSEKEFEGLQCPICILVYEEDEKICKLPKCKHHFHVNCLNPWLKQTSTCPLCRDELPTDDEAYENAKKFKEGEKQRKFEMDQLHDRMYV